MLCIFFFSCFRLTWQGRWCVLSLCCHYCKEWLLSYAALATFGWFVWPFEHFEKFSFLHIVNFLGLDCFKSQCAAPPLFVFILSNVMSYFRLLPGEIEFEGRASHYRPSTQKRKYKIFDIYVFLSFSDYEQNIQSQDRKIKWKGKIEEKKKKFIFFSSVSLEEGKESRSGTIQR